MEKIKRIETVLEEVRMWVVGVGVGLSLDKAVNMYLKNRTSRSRTLMLEWQGG